MAVPPYRRLRVYTFDPSIATQLETALYNQTVLRVPWEPLEPGPVGEYVEVVDYDPASECFYAPVNLDDPTLLAQDGLAPSEGNPQFHQQMAYAVVMATVHNFEKALGRKAIWAPHLPRDPKTGEVIPGKVQGVEKLRIYPHALREANAYYSPDKKALLFGYFPAALANVEGNLPGGLVFTCLSHDVVAHETTHALLDGLHRYFTDPSNPDVPAFHEGFADIVALFQHFSHPVALRHQISKTRGSLRSQNLLGELAQQFGQAIGNHGALRDFIGEFDEQANEWRPRPPRVSDYESSTEPHDRGAVLVAALFDAFLAIYERRTADLVRIATGGSGVLPAGAIHPDLVDRLADEAAKTASHMLRMAIRALDYCPPVDITFGEYLRALVTGDADIVTEDRWGYRIAVIEGFRRRGIYPRDVRVLAADALLWDPPTAEMPNFAPLIRHLKTDKQAPQLPTFEWLTMGTRTEFVERTDRYRLLTWLWMKGRLGGPNRGQAASSHAAALGLALGPDAPPTIYRSKSDGLPTLEIHSIRAARRMHQDGRMITDLVIEMTQRRRGYLDAAKQARADKLKPDSPKFLGEYAPDFTFRGGCTVLVNGENGDVRYCLVKKIDSDSRLARQRAFEAEHSSPSLRATYDPLGHAAMHREPFAMLHRSY